MKITDKLSLLRAQMVEQNIQAYLITGADAHLSEYPPASWNSREWISGFTGSYGKVLVTDNQAFLWTDTRYFLQAEEELKETGISLMKERIPEAISVEAWLSQNMEPGSTVAVNGLTISAAEFDRIRVEIGANGIGFVNDLDLVSTIWKDRPSEANDKVYDHPLQFAGKSRTEKLQSVRKRLAENASDAAVVNMLDDIAWLFNLRGNEIEFNPLFTAFGYVDQSEAWLFINEDKIEEKERGLLNAEGIKIVPYESFLSFLSRMTGKCINADPLRTNSLVLKYISESNSIDGKTSIVTDLKAIKDPVEIENIKFAHLKDGAAMVRSIHWIYQQLLIKSLTELEIGHKLNEFRSREKDFVGDSFQSIVGFGPHGAIVHYHASPGTDSIVTPDNLLLIDSGGQYLDGTTDITRTICLGAMTEKQRKDFTLCLKAHVALATAVFPVGTRGYSLDPIARKPLWDNGINYGHGTGHGIGYFLSVHEGPISIRTEFNNEPIREGNIISNEPGVYRNGEYGVRIENVLMCKKKDTTEFGQFLCFETISFCPIDRKLIDVKLLSNEELNWINNYHREVFMKISPLISETAISVWLREQCEPLTA